MNIHVPVDTLPQLVRFRPDVIISCEMGMRTLQSAIYRRLFPKSRLVLWATYSEVTEQGRGRLRHSLRTGILRTADAIIVNGESGARYIERFGVKRERLFLVPYTTNLDPLLALPATRPPHVRHRLLYSGMLTERKGLLPFLAHLAAWARRHSGREIELHVAGDGPLRARVAAFSGPSNLKMRLLGAFSYDHLARIYSDCGILAFPTLADEWGLVVTEAMASGVPVLGSLYSQAVEELIRDGQNGWLFRPDHDEDIQNALDRALATPTAEVNEMGASARAAVQDLTPPAMADRIMSAVQHAKEAKVARSSLSYARNCK